VFVTADGAIKLGDFGIARVMRHTVDVTRSLVGTPYYLSPEIIDSQPYSFKSDIWSLGVLLYELCALRPPFEGQSMNILCMQIVRGKPPALPAVFSKPLRQLVQQCLTVDVKKRISLKQLLMSDLIAPRICKLLNDKKIT
jgi:NIMA (never in mitosis gene a)-related kinase